MSYFMSTLLAKRHIEIIEAYQCINLTEFDIRVEEEIDNDKIVDTFIHLRQLSFDSLQHFVKTESKKGQLRTVFNFDEVKISDFKKTDKQGISKFLFTFINEPDWGDDRDAFAKLLDRYFEIYKEFSTDDFYILSKDWFVKNDERIIEVESWVYIYYFLIISIDRNAKLLILTEWIYD